MNNSQVVIIGAGASGMMSAIAAAQKGASVVILEKKERPGRKIRITGKGRCNITNTKPWAHFSTHLHPNQKFLRPAFYSFSNDHTINFFEEIGVKCVVERGDRVFPQSGSATTVVDALQAKMASLGVEQHYNTPVLKVGSSNNRVDSVVTRSHTYNPGALIIATGGLSYPLTGSTGDGYKFAKSLGHSIVECWPSLTALMPKNYSTELEGVTLKNIELSLFIVKDMVQLERGDIDFTNNGIEGSLGFRVSRKAVKALINGNSCYLVINLKPAVSDSNLESRITKEIKELSSNSTTALLRKFMPKQLISTFIRDNNLPESLLNIRESYKFVIELRESLKHWKIEIVSYTSYERAVITAGGISLNEVYPKTMRSRLIENLFLSGEVLDLDGDTGGYNLQIAFSTGFRAGEEAAAYLSLKEA
ncbi:MAG: NAD(P)/FAD-dependent oxidoreductase [Bacteroidales bacterium]|nr:NAD(P)/FAD-dependent oxidoreductase [Bacteroidales bacterium]